MSESTARHAANEAAKHRDIATNPYAHRCAWIAQHGPRPAPRTHRYAATVAVAK